MCKVREYNNTHMKEVKEELLANDIKKLFTNFLQNKFPVEGLGYEIMYGTSRRVVDMLAIIRGRTYAIEIKSAADNIKRLSGQIEEYQKVFDYIIVVASKKHCEEIRALIDKNIGLYAIDSSQITLLKHPYLNKKQEKIEILNTIPSNLIKRHYKIKGRLNSDEIRIKASLKAKLEIHHFFLRYLLKKINAI